MLIVTGLCGAQIKTELRLAKEDEMAVEQAKQTFRLIRKFKRDSLVIAKRLEKEYGTNLSVNFQAMLAARTDSLREVYGLNPQSEVLDKEYVIQKISKRMIREARKREEVSILIREAEKHKGKLEELKSYYTTVDELPDSLRSFGRTRIENIPDRIEEEAGRLKEVQEINKHQDVFNDIQTLVDKEALINQGERAVTDMAESHLEVIGEAVNYLKKLKKKYVIYPGKNGLNESKKAGSLADASLSKRMRWGGTLQLQRGTDNTIDFNPFVAYRLNKFLSVGTGATYRASFGYSIASYRQEALGWSTYLDHFIKPPYFGHAEFSQLKEIRPEHNGIVESSFMAGLGREFSMKGKWKAVIELLYNFSYSDSYLFSNPWNFKFGFIKN